MKCPKCQSEILDDSRFCRNCGAPIHQADDVLFPHTRTILRPLDTIHPGTLLAGKYKIEKIVGRGGMGIVYRAEDTKLKRKVALKFMPPELIRDAEAKDRFELEAQSAAALSHPNICTIHEIDEDDGKSFIAMEFVEGESLKAKLEKGALDTDEFLSVATQIVEGLDEAHKKGIVHRDIKSSNIMIKDNGQAKIMDFGLAKVKGGTLLTREGTTLGTVAYMSPEQARGEGVDHRSDIWSWGVVMYEMVSGKLPFTGDREASILYSVVHEDIKPIKSIKPGVPPELQQVINRALKKKPEARYSSALEMLNDLKKFQDSLKAEEMGAVSFRSLKRLIRRPIVVVPAILVAAAATVALVWFYNRQVKIRWAREEVIPEIERLVENGEIQNAFPLAEEIEPYVSNDRRLLDIWPQITRQIAIETDPPGAQIYWKFYTAVNEDWKYLGVTPIVNVRYPRGFTRLMFEKDGFCTVQIARAFGMDGSVSLVLDQLGEIPDEMVRVKSGDYTLRIPGLSHLPPLHINDYFIDKYEVTNREYKQFVLDGGYEKKEFWKHPFVKDNKALSWEEAMSEFRDGTGRTGPAAWEAGDYPSGQEDYPVSGISWYEAAAYAEYAGKNLPSIYHWNVAASTSSLTPYIVPLSNFSDQGPAPVGQSTGMSLVGTFDMAGNVREWCSNASGNSRFILGGGWNDQTYMFNDSYVQPPFDRSLTNGFRCIQFPEEEHNLEALNKPIEFPYRNFMEEEPVPDDIFQIFLNMYAYDKTGLNAEIESIDESAEHWIKEKVSFDAAYGNDRVVVYLFLPKMSPPPYQTIIFFPGTSAIRAGSSEGIGTRIFDFILKTGRAVIFPVYKGTFERQGDFIYDYPDIASTYKEYVVMQIKDLARSIDYLETRADIDSDRLAYYGVSWGGAMGAVVPAVERRLKASILYVAGLDFQKPSPEVDAINYVTRVTCPVLMLNGRHDHFFPVESSQKPMFQLLGTPPENKKYVLYETGHFVPRNKLIEEALAWLDRYLGPVN